MFDLEDSGFYSILSSLCKLILGHLEILSGLEYPISLVLQPLFLIGHWFYHLIVKELIHDPKVLDIPRKFPKVSKTPILLLIILDQ